MLTTGSLWKMTTRPPLSPVASKSPSWLNSTHEMMSAAETDAKLNVRCDVTVLIGYLNLTFCNFVV